jgi:YD repeat-containing protein
MAKKPSRGQRTFESLTPAPQIPDGYYGPLGRRTSFTYDGSNNIRRVQDPSGRITSLTVNASTNLVRIVTPELCTTSLVYNGANSLTAWITS